MFSPLALPTGKINSLTSVIITDELLRDSNSKEYKLVKMQSRTVLARTFKVTISQVTISPKVQN